MSEFVHFEKVTAVATNNRPKEGKAIKCRIHPSGAIISVPIKEIHDTSTVKNEGEEGELRVKKVYANSRGWKEAPPKEEEPVKEG